MTETAATYGDDEQLTKQSPVTLGDRVQSDFRLLAKYQGTTYSTVLRQILETHWANPGTQKLIERAKNEHISD